MEGEKTQLREETERCSSDLCTLRREATEVQENCCITAAVNAKQTNQIAEKEGRVSQLLGEVEVLRARKAVVMRWLCERGGLDGGEKLDENRLVPPSLPFFLPLLPFLPPYPSLPSSSLSFFLPTPPSLLPPSPSSSLPFPPFSRLVPIMPA